MEPVFQAAAQFDNASLLYNRFMGSPYGSDTPTMSHAGACYRFGSFAFSSRDAHCPHAADDTVLWAVMWSDEGFYDDGRRKICLIDTPPRSLENHLRKLLCR